jgi:hypothetical protein
MKSRHPHHPETHTVTVALGRIGHRVVGDYAFPCKCGAVAVSSDLSAMLVGSSKTVRINLRAEISWPRRGHAADNTDATPTVATDVHRARGEELRDYPIADDVGAQRFPAQTRLRRARQTLQAVMGRTSTHCAGRVRGEPTDTAVPESRRAFRAVA